VSRQVSSVMTKKLITTTPDCPIEEAARTLRSSRIGALPVLKENKLVGIITESDIFDAFVNMTAAKSGGVRILVESEAPENPVPSILELSRQYRVDILSLIWFHENRLRGQDMSIFRFGNRLPSAFLQEITKSGFRIVSVEG
jgi:acetoin utilization protein AcuB